VSQTLRTWVRGLVGAAINSAGSAITIVIVDPSDFNPMDGGLQKLLTVMVVSAALGAGLWLKTHPLPTE
jgi:hypothetical protein